MAKQVVNLYELIPEQKRPFEVRADGTVDVLVPRYGGGRLGGWLGSLLSKKPVRVQLDDIGTSVWNLCDGQRSVQEIGHSLQEEFGERIEPVYDRLGEFLKRMKNADLIALNH